MDKYIGVYPHNRILLSIKITQLLIHSAIGIHLEIIILSEKKFPKTFCMTLPVYKILLKCKLIYSDRRQTSGCLRTRRGGREGQVEGITKGKVKLSQVMNMFSIFVVGNEYVCYLHCGEVF